MREMWELPGRTTKDKLIRASIAVGLVWALVAVPLSLWLALRDPEVPPPPAERELSVMEQAAATSARTALGSGFVQVRGQVTTPTARFTVTETVQAASGDAIGKITSGSESADLLVSSNTVFLRGNSAFWSTVGVPTSFGGWVEVGTALGNIAFPLSDAVAALAADPQARVVAAESDSKSTVYRTEKASAKFSSDGITSITFGDRTVEVKAQASDVSAPLAAAHGDVAGAAKLSGTSGALTVSEAPKPAPPRPAPGSAAGRP